MPETPSTHKPAPAQLTRVKTLFFAGLILFIGLTIACGFIFDFTGDETGQAAAPTSSELFRLHQQANLQGQVLGLSQRPETMPAYEDEWVLKLSRKEVLKNPNFAQLPAEEIEVLVNAFVDGYISRFQDYYDDRFAQDAGYQFGLKIDPENHPLPRRELITSNLHLMKNEIVQGQQLNEAAWQIFVAGFYKGLQQGYLRTKPGTSAVSNQPIGLRTDLGFVAPDTPED